MSNFTNNLKDGFTVTPNSILNCGLKLEAIGLYTFLASKPTGWDFSYKGLASQLVESEKALRRIVKMLVEAKLLLRIPSRNGSSFSGWDWILHPTEEQLKKYTDPALKNTSSGTTLLGTTENSNDQIGNFPKGKYISNKELSNTKEAIYKRKKINKKKKKSRFEVLRKLILRALKRKKLLSYKAKVNIIVAEKELKELGFNLDEVKLAVLAREYAEYILANKNYAVRLNKYLIAYLEGNLSDLNSKGIYNHTQANKNANLPPKNYKEGVNMFELVDEMFAAREKLQDEIVEAEVLR